MQRVQSSVRWKKPVDSDWVVKVTIGKRGVVQMNLEGIVLNSFDSIKEATIMLNININSTSHISGCCGEKRKSAFGFKWKYKHDTEM